MVLLSTDRQSLGASLLQSWFRRYSKVLVPFSESESILPLDLVFTMICCMMVLAIALLSDFCFSNCKADGFEFSFLPVLVSLLGTLF